MQEHSDAIACANNDFDACAKANADVGAGVSGAGMGMGASLGSDPRLMGITPAPRVIARTRSDACTRVGTRQRTTLPLSSPVPICLSLERWERPWQTPDQKEPYGC